MFGLDLDWKLASIIAMLTLAAYNLAIKAFFSKGNDWRALVPFVFLGVLAAFLYFLMTYKEISFTQETIALSLALLACLALTTAFGWYALSKGSVNVYIAILTVSTPLTIFAASFLFPGEKLSAMQWLGVVLAMVSVYLVSTG